MLLADVEQYLAEDTVDTDDDAARLAANVLWRHFGAGAEADTPEEDWAKGDV